MDNINLFDEEKAVKFIREKLSDFLNNKYSDDDILDIIDLIWDYYEEKGFLSLNLDDIEEQLDTDDLIKYVREVVRKEEGINVDYKDVEQIIKAELEYEDSLEDFI